MSVAVDPYKLAVGCPDDFRFFGGKLLWKMA